jgi:hypothetical protein
MNIECGLTPDKGVEKLMKKQTQELKDNIDDVMEGFQAKSCHWTVHSNGV